MSRVLELLDDFDESMKLTDTPDPATVASGSIPFPIKPTPNSHEDMKPQLPPQMQSVRSHTADEIVQMMNKTPLFMTSLENADDGTCHPASRSAGGFSSEAAG